MIAKTPPMGWNSWNSGVQLTEGFVRETIDAMVSSQMRDAGYTYVNLDAGWAAPTRDSDGRLAADPDRFPNGIAPLARYAHDRGLRLGLYSSPYNEICGQGRDVASAGHETVDAQTFAGWEIDFLKYDWCRVSAEHDDQVRVFTEMSTALQHSGRRILFSINPNSSQDASAGTTYDWSTVADMVRVSGDLLPIWDAPGDVFGPSVPFFSDFNGVRDQFSHATPSAGRHGPGRWNDPDMLVVGVQWSQWFRSLRDAMETAGPPEFSATDLAQLGFDSLPDIQALTETLTHPADLSLDEQRAHFSLWAILGAPLIAGNDLRTMTEDVRSVLTNRGAIAVNQDPLVAQGVPLAVDESVIVKPLVDGSVAVALYNRDDAPRRITTDAASVGLPSAPSYLVTDLWTGDQSVTGDRVGGKDVAPHSVTLLVVDPR